MEIKEGFIICDTKRKKEILKEIKGFHNYTFLTFSELQQKIYGKCEPQSIFELMKQYQLSYEIAKEYIRYIPFVNQFNTTSVKLDSIHTAKEYLISKDLFHKDEFFYYRLPQFPVTFLDIENSIEKQNIIEVLKEYTEVYEYTTEESIYQPKVYAFPNILDEVNYVCNQMVKLIQDGIEPQRIHLCNLDADYEYLFERAIKTYQLPLSLSKKKNINALKIAKTFLRECEMCSSFHEVLDKLDKNSKYYRSIMNIIVDYNLEEQNPKEYVSFFQKQFEQIAFEQKRYEKEISTRPQSKYLSTDYVFFLGLNLGSCPKVYKDDGYLSDNELEQIGLITSTIRNVNAKEELRKILFTTKHITITYKTCKDGEEYFPASVIKEWNLEVEEPNTEYGYSPLEDQLRLGILYTQYQKFKVLHEDIQTYNLHSLEYMSYNNQYQKISKKILDERFANKPLKMAYSNIKNYFACPFSYYADRILGFNEFKPNMAARMGSFSHAVLEDSYQNEFDFEQSVLIHTGEYAENSKDKFYFAKMHEILKDLIEFNKIHESQSLLTNIKREVDIEITEGDISFEGYIDKLMYVEINNEIYAAIIDYKTGKDVISLDNVEDGFHLQLPSYMYLLSKYEEFEGKTIHIIGIYLQKVNIIALDNTMDIVAQRHKSFRLRGFSIADKSMLSMLDPSYDKSDYIQSMSIVKSGEFSKYAKIIEEKSQKELIGIVEKLLKQANDGIRSGQFEIAPKMINEKNESCTFCKYKDLCYMDYKDLVKLEYKPFPKREEEA